MANIYGSSQVGEVNKVCVLRYNTYPASDEGDEGRWSESARRDWYAKPSTADEMTLPNSLKPPNALVMKNATGLSFQYTRLAK